MSTAMEYRQLGATGLSVSRLSLGTWVSLGEKSDDEQAKKLIELSYERGVNFFDTADKYADGRAESTLGRLTAELPREALVLASKVWAPTMEGPNGRGLSRKHIMESCHASLKRLGTDYLDIYYCHSFDASTPIAESVRAMNDLIHQGKVLYWGVSNWRASQIAQAVGIAKEGGYYLPIVEQPQYSMFIRQKVESELAPVAEELGIGLVTYSPLRFGLLTGKYNDGPPEAARVHYRDWLHPILTDEESLDKVRKLGTVARDLEVTVPQLAIGWLLRVPQVTSVILGASRATQLEENLGALQVPAKLTDEVLERIEGILMNEPKPPE